MCFEMSHAGRERGNAGRGEADGVDDGGEPGAEVGVRYNFKQVAVVGVQRNRERDYEDRCCDASAI